MNFYIFWMCMAAIGADMAALAFLTTGSSMSLVTCAICIAILIGCTIINEKY